VLTLTLLTAVLYHPLLPTLVSSVSKPAFQGYQHVTKLWLTPGSHACVFLFHNASYLRCHVTYEAQKLKLCFKLLFCRLNLLIYFKDHILHRTQQKSFNVTVFCCIKVNVLFF
jgi:hypothetical protein